MMADYRDAIVGLLGGYCPFLLPPEAGELVGMLQLPALPPRARCRLSVLARIIFDRAAAREPHAA